MTEHTGWRMETRGVRDVMVPTSRPQTLAEFLLACFAEDEAAARAADSGGVSFSHDLRMTPAIAQGAGAFAPTRVLAECEAKTAIVELHSQDEHDCVEMHHGAYPADWPVEAAWGKAGEPWAHPSLEHQVGPCPTLLALALPYADHPDFREEWRL